MSVSTKVYLVNRFDIDKTMSSITKALKNEFKDKLIEDSINSRIIHFANKDDKFKNYHFREISLALDYDSDQFEDNKEHRSINIFQYFDNDIEKKFYSILFNAWGHNKEIAKCLVDYFGGYVNYNDCDNVEIDYCVSEHDSKLGVKS